MESIGKQLLMRFGVFGFFFFGIPLLFVVSTAIPVTAFDWGLLIPITLAAIPLAHFFTETSAKGSKKDVLAMGLAFAFVLLLITIGISLKPHVMFPSKMFTVSIGGLLVMLVLTHWCKVPKGHFGVRGGLIYKPGERYWRAWFLPMSETMLIPEELRVGGDMPTTFTDAQTMVSFTVRARLRWKDVPSWLMSQHEDALRRDICEGTQAWLELKSSHCSVAEFLDIARGATFFTAAKSVVVYVEVEEIALFPVAKERPEGGE